MNTLSALDQSTCDEGPRTLTLHYDCSTPPRGRSLP